MKNEVLPKDFSSTVKDIKLAILQARAKAAHLANAEALKLYFFVGGYISKKTRNAKWGSGAINALSERLQVELPGLRGFSPQHMRFMRQFFEAWISVSPIQHLVSVEFRYLPSSEMTGREICYLPSSKLEKDDIAAFFSIGFTHHREIIRFCKNFDERLYYIHACAKGMWSVEQLLEHLRADDYHHIGALPNNFEKTLSPIALATQTVRSFKDEYLLDLVNLDNVDARYGYETDERVFYGRETPERNWSLSDIKVVASRPCRRLGARRETLGARGKGMRRETLDASRVSCLCPLVSCLTSLAYLTSHRKALSHD